MSARHWSDAWGSHAGLAGRLGLVALQSPTITLAVAALLLAHNNQPQGANVAVLADDVRGVADLAARRGEYEDYAALADAADALDELATPHDRGPFVGVRPDDVFRPPVPYDHAADYIVTEHEPARTARYALVGLGHPEQPPELVRVWASDPDDVDDTDDGVPL